VVGAINTVHPRVKPEKSIESVLTSRKAFNTKKLFGYMILCGQSYGQEQPDA
jgi:hypothetical protein